MSAYGVTWESARLIDTPIEGGGRILGDVNTTSVDIFPASLEYVKPLGQWGPLVHGLGVSVVVPDFQQFNGTFEAPPTDAAFEFRSRQTARNQTFWLGAAWGACLETVCFGLGPTGAVSIRDQYLSSTLFSEVGDGVTIDRTETRQSELLVASLGAQIGVQVQALDTLRFGFTVRSSMRTVYSSGSLLVTAAQITGDNAHIDRVEVTAPRQKFRLPWRFGLGVAYEPTQKWKFGFDVRLHLGQDEVVALAGPNGEESLPPMVLGQTVDNPLRALDVSEAFSLNPTVNMNLGGQVFLTDTIALQLGLFTDFSSTPDADVLDNGNDELNRIGGTLGVGWKGESLDTWLNVIYTEGWGQALGLGEELMPFRARLSSRSIIFMLGSWATL